jgi:hypothetical protein
MNTPDRDPNADLLSRVLSEEASTVQTDPAALQRIQARVRKARGGSVRRRWLATSAAGLATAATITAVVLVAERADSPTSPPPAAGQSEQHPGEYQASGPTALMYYLGSPGPTGRVYLQTEPHSVPSQDPAPSQAAVHEFLTSTPIDADYSSGWPAGVDVTGITTDGNVVTIALAGDADLAAANGLTRQEAATAIQALVRTAGVTDGAVRFTYNDDPVDRLLGVRLSGPVSAAPDQGADMTPLLAPVQVVSPVEGQTVSAPVTVTVSGNVFEGTVNWQLLDRSGAEVDSGYVTTAFMEWRKADVRLGGLPAGTYTFRAFEASAEDGSATFVDDKTFTVD